MNPIIQWPLLRPILHHMAAEFKIGIDPIGDKGGKLIKESLEGTIEFQAPRRLVQSESKRSLKRPQLAFLRLNRVKRLSIHPG